MVFSSSLFLFLFLPITLLLYYLFDKRYRNMLLLVVSLLFFSWSQPQYLYLILLSIGINYMGGVLLGIIDEHNRYYSCRKMVLALSVFLNLGLLIYFKYSNFFIGLIFQLNNITLDVETVILPIGISFFTFQGMSYVIDVYRRDVPVQKNILKIALYISLFPQLIAGPIVRYTDVVNEIDNRNYSIDAFSEGICRFIIGLGKKSIVANTLGFIVDDIWGRGLRLSSAPVLWLSSICYTLQIYYDFSGYSDMAIGMGKMFGFHFPENFNLPYTSRSISEFWRRWHITLGSWFRDYLYIPLGGNRKHVYFNLAIVFILTGLWHGAAWNFIIWGAFHGIFILAERFLEEKNRAGGIKNIVTNFARIVYVLSVVNVGWVIFRADSISNLLMCLRIMFGLERQTPLVMPQWYLTGWNSFTIIIALIFASSIPAIVQSRIANRINTNGGKCQIIKYAMMTVLLLLSLTQVISGTYNPFIYFQF